MKITLTKDFIKRLTIEKLPIDGVPPKDWPDNPGLKPYIVFDTKIVGFGVKVTSGGNASYIVQRVVHPPGGKRKAILATIGKTGSVRFEDAQEHALDKIKYINSTGKNPNEVRREQQALDHTLGGIARAYRDHLAHRGKPAKLNSINTFEKAIAKMTAWGFADKHINDLSEDEILRQFQRTKATHPTAAEQTARAMNTAVHYALNVEAWRAQRENEQPLIRLSPFDFLKRDKHYRSRADLEQSYRSNNKRRPLSLDQTLGPWLKGIQGRRAENPTGCDYLLCATLWGCRKSEAGDLMWRDRMSDSEAEHCSYVDLSNNVVVMNETKNGLTHRLPLSIGARRILTRRWEDSQGDPDPFRRQWVFPARSGSPLRKSPFYKDSRSLRWYISADMGLTFWDQRIGPDGKAQQIERSLVGMHDLRRTFATALDALNLSDNTKRLLNHETGRGAITAAVSNRLQNKVVLSDPTTGYTSPEFGRLREVMQRVEAAILSTCPSLYNELLTPEFPPIKDVADPAPLPRPQPKPGVPVFTTKNVDKDDDA